MNERKLEREQEQKNNQDVLGLIEDSLGDVSGGRGTWHYKGGNIDDNHHWHGLRDKGFKKPWEIKK